MNWILVQSKNGRLIASRFFKYLLFLQFKISLNKKKWEESWHWIMGRGELALL